MTHFFLRSRLAVTFSLLTLAAAAYAEERPFHADGEGVRIISSNPISNVFAYGEATHLGHSLLFADVNNYLLRTEGRLVLSGAGLAAANGDGVFLNIDVAVDPDTGIAFGTMTFTGGTGRFQGAAGSADVMLLFDVDFSSFDFLIEGTIDY